MRLSALHWSVDFAIGVIVGCILCALRAFRVRCRVSIAIICISFKNARTASSGLRCTDSQGFVGCRYSKLWYTNAPGGCSLPPVKLRQPRHHTEILLPLIRCAYILLHLQRQTQRLDACNGPLQPRDHAGHAERVVITPDTTASSPPNIPKQAVATLGILNITLDILIYRASRSPKDLVPLAPRALAHERHRRQASTRNSLTPNIRHLRLSPHRRPHHHHRKRTIPYDFGSIFRAEVTAYATYTRDKRGYKVTNPVSMKAAAACICVAPDR